MGGAVQRLLWRKVIVTGSLVQEASIMPAETDQTLDLGAGANLQVLVAGKCMATILKSNKKSQLLGWLFVQ